MKARYEFGRYCFDNFFWKCEQDVSRERSHVSAGNSHTEIGRFRRRYDVNGRLTGGWFSDLPAAWRQ